MSDVLNVDLRDKSVPLDVTAEDGQKVKWNLHALSGKARGEYMTLVRSKSDKDDDGNLDVTDFRGLETDLLLHCLRDENGKPVPRERIESFPGTALAAMYEVAAQLSGLRKDSEDAAKNSSTKTEKN